MLLSVLEERPSPSTPLLREVLNLMFRANLAMTAPYGVDADADDPSPDGRGRKGEKGSTFGSFGMLAPRIVLLRPQ